MGGKNHQPCRPYLKDSANLSRYLSLAYAELELGNVALEDLIITELDGGRGSIIEVMNHLHASFVALEGAYSATSILRLHMRQNAFTDLPILRVIDLESIGERFAAKNLVNGDAWRRISSIMRSNGFFGVTDYFLRCIQELEKRTTILIESIKYLPGAESAEEGRVSTLLEENKAGDVKEAFADLYTSWMEFDQEFLASSILSTELWYKQNTYGSLCKEQDDSAAA